MKRSSSTDTQLLKQNHQLQKLLADQLKSSAEREARLVDALDRVLVSKFDPPLMPKPMEQANNLSFPDVSDMLSVEDDSTFIKTMETLTK
jgi:hypothetical protein